MTDVFQTVEVSADHLAEMGLPHKINSTHKNEASYKRRIAMTLRVRQLLVKLANDRPPGITIDVNKLPYTINTIYNYVCSALTVLELYSTNEKYSILNQGYRTRMQGNTIAVLSKSEYNKRKTSILKESVDAIELATSIVSSEFSLKDDVSEWLEDVAGVDRKIMDNIDLTVRDKEFLEAIKDEGTLYDYIYMKEVKVLTLLRVREQEEEIEEIEEDKV
tara:strand:+ start:9306 stop:9962 length:657 start_codon:yes stop_codon:yes gene_type:complete